MAVSYKRAIVNGLPIAHLVSLTRNNAHGQNSGRNGSETLHSTVHNLAADNDFRLHWRANQSVAVRIVSHKTAKKCRKVPHVTFPAWKRPHHLPQVRLGLLMTHDTIIYWVRSVGPSGKDRVAMYYKGRWGHNCEDGNKGDVRARPFSLGPGEYTATYNPDAFEMEDGTPVKWSNFGQ